MEQISNYVELAKNKKLNVDDARKFQFALICLCFLTLGAQRRQVVAGFAIDVSIFLLNKLN